MSQEDFVAEIVGAPSEQTPVESKGAVEESTKTESTEAKSEPTIETTNSETHDESGLIELPDGRKVTPEEVASEYKNLLSDYTRKSQELANYKKAPETINNQKLVEQQEWVPQTWDEVLTVAEQKVLQRLEASKLAEVEAEKNLVSYIDSQIQEVKKIDPNVNETKLLNHANRYKIPNLIHAYENMREMNKVIEKTREQTAQSIQKRNSDPVATDPGQVNTIDDSEVYDPHARSTSLVEYIRQLKK